MPRFSAGLKMLSRGEGSSPSFLPKLKLPEEKKWVKKVLRKPETASGHPRNFYFALLHLHPHKFLSVERNERPDSLITVPGKSFVALATRKLPIGEFISPRKR